MKVFSGKVVAKNNPKTAVVLVGSFLAHPVYKKRMRVAKKYQVNDSEAVSKVGDSVKFVTKAPISKTKKWHIVEIIKPKKLKRAK